MLTSVTQRQREIIRPYEGPCCPRCDAKLMTDWIRTGIVRCPDCNRDFEATAFNPSAPKLKIAEVATIGPAGANACANHARNVATTSCTRCGLFICALCDMNVGSGSYCPACFDRVRAEGTLPVARKVRDYYSLARVASVAGLVFLFIFLGPLFGILTLHYQNKGRREMRQRGENPWTGGAIVVMILAVLLIAGGLLYDIVGIWSLTRTTK